MNYVYTATKLVKFFQTNVTITGKLNEKPRRTQKKAKRSSLLTTPQKAFRPQAPPPEHARPSPPDACTALRAMKNTTRTTRPKASADTGQPKVNPLRPAVSPSFHHSFATGCLSDGYGLPHLP